MHYVRTRDYKYIRSYAATPEDRADAPSEVLATHCAGKWVRCDDHLMNGPSWRAIDDDFDPPPPEELYDLRQDPWEQENLMESENPPAELDRLRGMLEEMMERTDSPVLTGHVEPPPEQKEAARTYRPGGPKYRKE
jgi:hypothetical protein